MNRLIDLTGRTFGEWTVTGKDSSIRKYKNIYWICRCSCGSVKSVYSQSLKNGGSVSCGCKTNELISAANKVHGLHGHPLNMIWCNMRRRCGDPKIARYKSYGGRGITVCDEWNSNFVPFYNWAISNGYARGLSIERIDVDGNYCPDNCKWIPLSDQVFNRTDTRLIEYLGIKKTINEWSAETGITRSAIVHRFDRGWSIDRIITTPLKIIHEVEP